MRIGRRGRSLHDVSSLDRAVDRITRRFPFLERVFADAGYQGPRVAAAAPRPVEIIKRTDTGFVVQPKRWVIERTFAWAYINRRLARDVERNERAWVAAKRSVADSASATARASPGSWEARIRISSATP